MIAISGLDQDHDLGIRLQSQDQTMIAILGSDHDRDFGIGS